MIDRVYGRPWAINRAGLETLVGGKAQQPGSQQTSIRQHLAEALQNQAELTSLEAEDLLINLGCFWSDQYGTSFAELHREAKFSYVPLLYDLIPVDKAELCEEQTARNFSSALPTVLRQAHAVLTISHSTRRRLEAFSVTQSSALPPIHVVTLAHQLDSCTGSRLVSDDSLSSIYEHGFALCVGTIEPRKNQLRLAEAWARLAADITRMPTLLIVGRLGWLAPSDLERLTALCASTGKIALISDVSDERLATLYARCLFTVFLSLDEGWGLPVGESLAFNKVCLASNAGAIPEAGGSLAVYVDPMDTAAITAALRTLITDAPRRRELEARIATELRLRTWSDVTTDLMDAVVAMAAGPQRLHYVSD